MIYLNVDNICIVIAFLFMQFYVSPIIGVILFCSQTMFGFKEQEDEGGNLKPINGQIESVTLELRH